MQFSAGDDIALAALGVTGLGILAREVRAKFAKAAANAQSDANTVSIIDAVTGKLDTVAKGIAELEEKRQKHELDCARVQERTAGTMERIAETLDRHDRNIGHLQAQMAHVASGAANVVSEIVPRVIKRKP